MKHKYRSQQNSHFKNDKRFHIEVNHMTFHAAGMEEHVHAAM